MAKNDNYYQIAIATKGNLEISSVKKVLDFIAKEIGDPECAIVISEMNPLAAWPVNFPMQQ